MTASAEIVKAAQVSPEVAAAVKKTLLVMMRDYVPAAEFDDMILWLATSMFGLSLVCTILAELAARRVPAWRSALWWIAFGMALAFAFSQRLGGRGFVDVGPEVLILGLAMFTGFLSYASGDAVDWILARLRVRKDAIAAKAAGMTDSGGGV